MLKTLHVRNLGVLGDVEVDFGDGLTVLTGETGAGKSLLVGAIKLLMGARADAGDVRTGETQALVEAVFECDPASRAVRDIAQAGFAAEDGEPGTVMVRRVVGADGRSRAHINGALASARDLRTLMGGLVSVAGQHAFIGLGVPAERQSMLDAFAGTGDLLERCAAAFGEWDTARKRLKQISDASQEREARRDYLTFVVSQIESVGLKAGDVERTHAEAAVLRGAGRLKELAAAAYDQLYDVSPSIYDQLSSVEQGLREMVAVDSSLSALLARLDSARIEVRELSRDILTYGDSVDLDPARLAAVEARMDAIGDLLRKYGGSEDAVLATLERARKELAVITGESGEEEGLVARVEATRLEWETIAGELGRQRRLAAARLGPLVTSAIRDLAMDGATFRVDVVPAEPGPDGMDSVEFMIEANPGEGYGQVADVASGGELSRITLGLYSVMSGSVGTPVIVYDEIDAGVSGGVAERMGRVLKTAAAGRQVLVVTHHGQVAACGDSHYKVFKSVVDGRTVAGVVRLDDPERVDEIARIIGGVQVTDKAREHAGEMLGTRTEGLLL